jgi:hypothetical protein
VSPPPGDRPLLVGDRVRVRAHESVLRPEWVDRIVTVVATPEPGFAAEVEDADGRRTLVHVNALEWVSGPEGDAP